MENEKIVERLDQLEKRVEKLENAKTNKDSGYGEKFAKNINDPKNMPDGLMVYAGKFTSKDGSVGSVFGSNCCKLENLLDFNAEAVANIIDAFASSERLNIIKELMKKRCNAKDLMDILQFNTTGKLYHHLTLLIKLGVVTKKDEQYFINPRFISCILLILEGAGKLVSYND